MTLVFRRASLLAGLALTAALVLTITLSSGTSLKEPLQLPTALANDPGAIDFFGVGFSGDTFVWCIDRSCSMGWGGELNLVKEEVAAAVLQLSPSHEMSATAFSARLIEERADRL